MAPGGYAWWYLDAVSHCGQHALVVIAFVGSVFSPYYAWARRRHGVAGANPQAHCAINVCLYSRGQSRWAMTERGAGALQRSATHLQVGPSAWHWDGQALCLTLAERGAPWPRRVAGQVRLWPQQLRGHTYPLDAAGRHQWWPVSPAAEVEVALAHPAMRWRGRAYLDSNRGTEPLEHGFSHWHWARAALPGGHAAVVYDAQRRDGSHAGLALHFAPTAEPEPFAVPPPAALPRGAWGVARATRSDAGHPARLLHGWEDGPFYTRGLVGAHWAGEPVTAVHESLSLARFSQPWVQALLPFRMPRRG